MSIYGYIKPDLNGLLFRIYMYRSSSLKFVITIWPAISVYSAL